MYASTSLVWKGSTLDGYTLQLTNSGLEKIISKLAQQPALKDLVRGNYDGNLKYALVRSIAQLTSNARRIGNLHHLRSGRRYPVFTVQVDDSNYQIITYPLNRTQNTIICLQSSELPELEAIYLGGSAQVTFQPLMPLNEAKSQNQGIGVYNIYKKEKSGKFIPVYVGQGDIQKELQAYARFLGLSDRSPNNYWAQWGNIRNPTNKRLKLIEHALILKTNKYLKSKKLKPLRNKSSIRPFSIKKRTNIDIRGGKSPATRGKIRLKPGGRLQELENWQ